MDSSIKKKIPYKFRKIFDKISSEKFDSIKFSKNRFNIFKLHEDDENSDFFFEVEVSKTDKAIYDIIYKPQSIVDVSYITKYIDFEEELHEHLEDWLNLIKLYNEPSPLFDDPIDNFSKINFDENSQFASEEIQQIKLALSELKEVTKNQLELNNTQFKLLSDRLDYLAEAVERTNKFDWKNIAMGSITSSVIALSLDTQKGQLLWKLFVDLISSIPSLLSK
jgi:hypothetical protein